MEPPEHRKWMYNRLISGRRGLTDEFVNGVEEFVSYASQLPTYVEEGIIRCPCIRCDCRKFQNLDVVKLHLYQKGFRPNYHYWTNHGEEVVVDPPVSYPQQDSQNYWQGYEGVEINQYETMVTDAAGPSFVNDYQQVQEQPNAEAQGFYEMLAASQSPLWDGCSNHSKLSAAMRLLNIKTTWNVPEQCYNSFLQFMKEAMPEDNQVPVDFYRTKKIVKKLGLGYRKIDCCLNGCMLYYKNDEEMTQCKFCHAPRFMECRKKRKNSKAVPVKQLWYLPLTPRLQRLYASIATAKEMRWHFENPRQPGLLSHPSDGEAWKHFDRTYPEFSMDPRNVRLGLCSDGFSPFGMSGRTYSCWPVIVTPYNLPPWLCMKSEYLFLTLIIPGPHNPKSKIDVYLQPLIDELKQLWIEGALTYDISLKQNFQMKAALMWTINDFPAYGMLSGWTTAGKLGCPTCMERSKAFSLKHSRKISYFDCHRMFISRFHPYRRNRDSFLKGRIEMSTPPLPRSGDEVWNMVEDLPSIVADGKVPIQGYGSDHNWTKQSIFWELPYWKTNLIRHNLDVMHIEKNVFDNVFNTVMDVKGKTKDTAKARMDIHEYCKRPELELLDMGNGKIIKPKAQYALNLEQKRAICEWVSNLKLPDTYVSNLGRCIDMREGKLFGMKSHDCHVFLECLLPIALKALPDKVWSPITELSQFFRDICSTTLREEQLVLMEQNIALTLCKLERIFPPSFFDSMEHLPIHLPYEARVGGPVQYRWMYPFER